MLWVNKVASSGFCMGYLEDHLDFDHHEEHPSTSLRLRTRRVRMIRVRAGLKPAPTKLRALRVLRGESIFTVNPEEAKK
jgi:hypothetical protein